MQGVWKSFQLDEDEAAHNGCSQAADHRVQGKIWPFSTGAGSSVIISCNNLTVEMLSGGLARLLPL